MGPALLPLPAPPAVPPALPLPEPPPAAPAAEAKEATGPAEKALIRKIETGHWRGDERRTPRAQLALVA